MAPQQRPGGTSRAWLPLTAQDHNSLEGTQKTEPSEPPLQGWEELLEPRVAGGKGKGCARQQGECPALRADPAPMGAGWLRHTAGRP